MSEEQILTRVDLPPKFTRLRSHQVDAINEIIEAFQEGADVVYVEAPTGSGKTVVAEVVRQLLNRRALYVCSDKKLQAQFTDDFPESRVIMGRNNYPTERMGDARDQYGRLLVSAEDCEGEECFLCKSKDVCPYVCARDEAAAADLAVLNTSYFMREAQSGKQSRFGGRARRELVIVDEADVLEDALMSHVEFEVSMWMWKKLGLRAPKKGVRKKALIEWLGAAAKAASDARDGRLFVDAKERRRCNAFIADCVRVAGELDRDDDADADVLEMDREGEVVSTKWLRDYDTKTLKLKPVLVSPYGRNALWRHGEQWLLMSGTFISPDQRAADTGVGGLEYRVVNVPMTFPVENRPIVMAPVADIKRASTEDDYANLVYAIEQISRRHMGERVLVHTVSKSLADRLVASCHLPGRNVVGYSYSGGKQDALDDYMSDPSSILFAQSMDRGVDLPGDACFRAGTKIMMADLSWKNIEDVRVGDVVVGIDEEPPGDKQYRRLRKAIVEATMVTPGKETFVVETTHGSFEATAEHPMLAMQIGRRNIARWAPVSTLQPGDRLRWVAPPSEVNPTREAGYLAGFFDGEGNLSVVKGKNHVKRISISGAQHLNRVYNEVKRCMESQGYAYTESVHQHEKYRDVGYINVAGRLSDKLRFLNEVRPLRLLKEFDIDNMAGRDQYCAIVKSVRPLARSVPVYNLQTSTSTYIANGFAAHNCRVVVVAKVPYPSLGDRRIAARMRLPGGNSWYQMQTVSTIVQMTGRGVRSETDHATAYVLDKQFATNLWSKSRHLLPKWWRDAVDLSMDVRWLMRSYEGTKHATIPELVTT